MSLLAEMNQKALGLGIPISVHLDVTYRCNERCVHCYLDHDDHGEMTTAEIKDILNQLSDAGVFFLTLSGGEVLMRRDFFEIVEHARRLLFNVKLKTNGVMIREAEARRIRELGVEQVQISVYSHRAEIHDAITKLPGSLKRTIEAIRFLKSQGLKVVIANVLMGSNFLDNAGVMALAKELGVSFTLDYISPYGDVFPCVQFPLPCGNLRRQRFADIWKNSSQLKEVRSIRARDLPTCSTCAHVGTCTRCPGLAYMEGNMRGPSTADCEKSFQRTGIATANMLSRARVASAARLIQIQAAV
ncbi:MAG: radical SAM protein [Terriglobales bacterium]